MPSCDACSSDCLIYIKPKEHEQELMVLIGTMEAKKERLEGEIKKLEGIKEGIIQDIKEATEKLNKALK